MALPAGKKGVSDKDIDKNGRIIFPKEIPNYGEGDAGKSLTVDEEGKLDWGNILPTFGSGDKGKSLTVNEDGDDLEWKLPSSAGFDAISGQSVDTGIKFNGHMVRCYVDSFVVQPGDNQIVMPSDYDSKNLIYAGGFLHDESSPSSGMALPMYWNSDLYCRLLINSAGKINFYIWGFNGKKAHIFIFYFV